MSGHSHWSTVKRQKKAEDAKKSKLFSKLSRAISVAVKEGQGNTDPNTNSRLRLAIEQSHLANMSKDSIKRAIERGSKAMKKGGLETVVFGGFILKETALLIEGITDNRRRTTAEIRNILESSGGVMASPEALEPYFKRQWVITVPRGERGEDECLDLALEVGAEDVILNERILQLLTTPYRLSSVKENLVKKGIKIEDSIFKLLAKITNTITEERDREFLKDVIQRLEQHDDITEVYTNATFKVA